jgi:uncharacterized membrane protein
MMMFGGMMLFWVLIILGAIWLVWALLGNRTAFLTGGSLTPRQILDQRFGRGEISREEYDQILSDLSR